jgi:hypothetical protein
LKWFSEAALLWRARDNIRSVSCSGPAFRDPVNTVLAWYMARDGESFVRQNLDSTRRGSSLQFLYIAGRRDLAPSQRASVFLSPGFDGKRQDLLIEVVPGIRRIIPRELAKVMFFSGASDAAVAVIAPARHSTSIAMPMPLCPYPGASPVLNPR